MCVYPIELLSLILHVILLQGIILVYDITNQKSFDNISKWLQNIEVVSEGRKGCICNSNLLMGEDVPILKT